MLPLTDFLEYGKKNALFSSNDTILLTVSGGKDSVLMAHLFHEAQIPFAIAHCNFQLRANESLRDATFVENLAKKLNVPFYSKVFETEKWAETHKISTQLAARELRYAWFESLRIQYQFTAIATAHHQNDVAETMLFNLVRGTGLAGLHGILPKNNYVIRPILFLNAIEINAIVHDNHIDFMEDSSNASTYYHRNQIRHITLPSLQNIHPETVQNMVHTAEKIRHYELMIGDFMASKTKEWTIENDKKGTKILVEKFNTLPYAQTIAYEFLKKFNFKSAQIPQILNENRTGAQFFSTSHLLIINRNEWHIQSLAESQNILQAIEINAHQNEVQFGEINIKISFSTNVQISKQPLKIHLDAQGLIFPLTLRNWQPGDQMKPLGMRGMKNISDIFVDMKLSLFEKQSTPILINGDGKIIWIVGKTLNDDFKITKNTKKILILDAE